MEAEPDATPGYEKNHKGDTPTSNKRNGHSLKTVKSQYGEFQIDIPGGSKITDRILPEIKEWQSRPLNRSGDYPFVFMDCMVSLLPDFGLGWSGATKKRQRQPAVPSYYILFYPSLSFCGKSGNRIRR